MPGIDTHALVTRLQQAGFDTAQAEALTDALKSIQDASMYDLVTRGDLKEAVLQLELKLETLKGDFSLMKWMFGGVFALLIPIFIKIILKL